MPTPKTENTSITREHLIAMQRAAAKNNGISMPAETIEKIIATCKEEIEEIIQGIIGKARTHYSQPKKKSLVHSFARASKNVGNIFVGRELIFKRLNESQNIIASVKNTIYHNYEKFGYHQQEPDKEKYLNKLTSIDMDEQATLYSDAVINAIKTAIEEELKPAFKQGKPFFHDPDQSL